MRVHSLRPPFTLEGIENGSIYSANGISPRPSNLFLEIASGGDLYIKIPSAYALRDLQAFVDAPESLGQWNIRQPIDAERFDRLDDALSVPAYTCLRRLESLPREQIYYLVLFMMQYRRLRTQTAVGIPEARFGAIRLRRFGLFHRDTPALFQQRIPGVTLWEMFDFEADRIRPEWVAGLTDVKPQLSALLYSPMAAHIDWNIKNFVLHATTKQLFYIDQKPTLFVAGHGNEHNLNGIRRHFLT